LAPLVDGPFRRLLAYRLWFSFFNGLGQAALNIYPRAVLGLGVLPMQLLPFGMRLGQLAASPAVGGFADRRGNRPVLVASQALVALGPLFYLLATPERSWWIVGAWLAYIAYAGTNICLPTLMLKLSPEVDNASHVAVFETLHGLAYGLSVIAGGMLFDELRRLDASWQLGSIVLDRFGLMFVAGAVTRALGIAWLVRIDEPGAKTWRKIVGEWRSGRSAT
jgi:MFS family permease